MWPVSLEQDHLHQLGLAVSRAACLLGFPGSLHLVARFPEHPETLFTGVIFTVTMYHRWVFKSQSKQVQLQALEFFSDLPRDFVTWNAAHAVFYNISNSEEWHLHQQNCLIPFSFKWNKISNVNYFQMLVCHLLLPYLGRQIWFWFCCASHFSVFSEWALQRMVAS